MRNAVRTAGANGPEAAPAVRRRVESFPLLANLYMNRFLKYWRMSRRGEVYRAYIVNYADDFVILSCGHAAEAMEWTRTVMTKLKLRLNESKTSIRNARKERFDFLGYTFGADRSRKTGR